MMDAILEIKINFGFQSCKEEKTERQRLAKISKVPTGTRCQMIDTISGLKCDSPNPICSPGNLHHHITEEAALI